MNIRKSKIDSLLVLLGALLSSHIDVASEVLGTEGPSVGGSAVLPKPAASGRGSTSWGVAVEDLPRSQFGAPPLPYTFALSDSFATPQFLGDLLYNPLQWGPFRVVPAVDYRFSYSDGLPNRGLAQSGQATAVHTIRPSLSLLSKHVTLIYSPFLNYYAKGNYEDSLGHAASLQSSFGYANWNFGLSHSYQNSSSVIAETARQTDTQSHSTSLSATYRWSDKTSFDFSVSHSSSEAAGLNGSESWSSMNWVDYHLTDITSLGLGIGGGFTASDRGSDMTFELLQGRVRWAPRPKINASLNGGVEVRQFTASNGVGDQENFIMGASASYIPFEQTTLTLNANRSIGGSVFTDQFTESTSFGLALSQRLLMRLRASVSGGFRFSDYQSSSRLVETDRSDEITFVSTSLGITFLKRASASIGYSFSQNASSESTFTYSSNTYFAQVGYSF